MYDKYIVEKIDQTESPHIIFTAIDHIKLWGGISRNSAIEQNIDI